MRQRRFELPRPFGRYHLKVVRLPISPSPLFIIIRSFYYWIIIQECKFNNYTSCQLSTYLFKTILKVVPFPGSEYFTNNCPFDIVQLFFLKGKAQAPATFFCGKSRFKNFCHILFADSFSGIRYINNYVSRFFIFILLSLSFHCIQCIF